MSILKSIIAEDDEISQLHLQNLCEQIKEVELLSIFSNGKDTLKYLEKNPVDLIFLDIEMPDMTGLELLEKLDFHPAIIVTTVNKEYALNAFDFDVTDFLLKPVNLPRLQSAIEKVKSEKQQQDQIAESSFLNELYIKVDGRLVRISVEDIVYFENVGDYIKVITEDKTHVIYGVLKNINERLRHPRLLKVHRSYIINLGKVKDIADNSVVMNNSKVIPISRAHKPVLLHSLNIL